MTRRRAAWAAYTMLALTNVAAVLVGAPGLATLTQVLLMPALVVAVLVTPPLGPQPLPRLRLALLVGLALSWLGDTAPRLVPSGAAFLTMMGFFLLAQVAFVAGFVPFRAESALRRQRWLVALYAVGCVGLVALCARGAGPLLVPVAVYGLVLTVMAVLSTGVHRLAGVGGLVFMLSDSLIALAAFAGLGSRATSAAIMATYALAEALLVLGVQSRRKVLSCPPAPTTSLAASPAPRAL